MKLARTFIPLCFAAAMVHAQTPPAAPEFEVASVKPSTGETDRVNVGVHVDGSQVHIADFSLQDYIRVAYRVKNYQVTGPDWLSERFNVDAKLARQPFRAGDAQHETRAGAAQIHLLDEAGQKPDS